MIDLQIAAATREKRTVTELDHVRIFNLLRRENRRGTGHSAVFDLVDSAELVSSQDIAPDVITMNSRVLVETAGDSVPEQLTLCFPEDANPGAGKLSILTAAGAALLGRRIGESVHWTTPQGNYESVRILAMLFQPEAHGDYTG